MNRQELVAAIAEKSNVSQKITNDVLSAFLETVQDTVKAGDTVVLVGFGTFELTERAARTGRNPQTGQPLEIEASKSPRFKPGKSFKDHVNG